MRTTAPGVLVYLGWGLGVLALILSGPADDVAGVAAIAGAVCLIISGARRRFAGPVNPTLIGGLLIALGLVLGRLRRGAALLSAGIMGLRRWAPG